MNLLTAAVLAVASAGIATTQVLPKATSPKVHPHPSVFGGLSYSLVAVLDTEDEVAAAAAGGAVGA